jgi:hypothetical protein
MRRGRPVPKLMLSDEERETLQAGSAELGAFCPTLRFVTCKHPYTY